MFGILYNKTSGHARYLAVLALVLTAGVLQPRILPASADTAKPLTEDQKIIHALNRLGFGPRPGDAERVRGVGLNRWMEAQLTPAALDDGAVEKKLARLTTLQLTPQQLVIAHVIDTSNFLKQAKQQEQGQVKPVALTPRQQELMTRVEESGLPKFISHQALGELRTAKVVRAVESQRQLQEVLVDFWSNHFNLDVRKGPVRTYKIWDEREVIRPHVLGKFRTLLGASAKSPAMLFYLDNVRSTRPIEMPQRMQTDDKPTPTRRNRGGINENYARELMELHTLGVDGGYTQRDVQEVARCFTGWTIDREAGTFRFAPRQHDNSAKVVLGQTIPANGGIKDGERVLDILASHPATARFVARKLCVRLVADEPPATLIDKAAKTFLDTDGDLRAVVRAIVLAPEFFSTTTYRTKIKSPFEYAVSAVRALGGEVTVPDSTLRRGRTRLIVDGRPNARSSERLLNSLVQHIGIMGQPLFAYQAPTGYSEDSREWVSSGALVSRLNFALSLAGGQVANVTLPPVTTVAKDPQELNQLAVRLLGGEVSAATRSTLDKELAAQPPADSTRLTALLLGSPEFQRR